MLSIITPSFQRRAMLELALDSVSALGVAHEHVVVDGGSDDGTVEMLEKRDVRWVSRPDRGMYDALNRGLDMARGRFVMFLNSDDRLVPQGVAEGVRRLREGSSPAACGDARIMDEARGTVRRISDPTLKELDRLEQLLAGGLSFNARIFRREAVEEVGPFDPNLRIAGDREWLLRAQRRGVSYVTVDAVVYEYRQHSGSLTFLPELPARVRREHLTIARRERRERDARERRVVDAWAAWELRQLFRRRRHDGELHRAVADAVAALRMRPRWVMSALQPDMTAPFEVVA